MPRPERRSRPSLTGSSRTVAWSGWWWSGSRRTSASRRPPWTRPNAGTTWTFRRLGRGRSTCGRATTSGLGRPSGGPAGTCSDPVTPLAGSGPAASVGVRRGRFALVQPVPAPERPDVADVRLATDGGQQRAAPDDAGAGAQEGVAEHLAPFRSRLRPGGFEVGGGADAQLLQPAPRLVVRLVRQVDEQDRKSTRLNSS